MTADTSDLSGSTSPASSQPPISAQTIAEAICAALTEQFSQAQQSLTGEQLYGYVLLFSSGFYAPVIVANSREQLVGIQAKLEQGDKEVMDLIADHADLLELVEGMEQSPEAKALYGEIFAVEWPLYLPENSALAQWDQWLEKLYQFEYGELAQQPDDDWQINTFIADAVSAGILRFKQQHPQAENLLLGLQFTDADGGEEECALMLAAAKQVNNKHWLAKINTALS